jgi:hypothetical protein
MVISSESFLMGGNRTFIKWKELGLLTVENSTYTEIIISQQSLIALRHVCPMLHLLAQSHWKLDSEFKNQTAIATTSDDLVSYLLKIELASQPTATEGTKLQARSSSWVSGYDPIGWRKYIIRYCDISDQINGKTNSSHLDVWPLYTRGGSSFKVAIYSAQ